MSIARDDDGAARIDAWRRRLIDLTYRNRLINYRPTRASTIEIERPVLDELLADPSRRLPWRFYFPPDESMVAPSLPERAPQQANDRAVAEHVLDDDQRDGLAEAAASQQASL